MRVCLITSLSRRLLGLLLDSLRWWRLIDLTLCPEDVPRGCPWPDLMLTAMLRLGVEDVREAAFAASTASEIQCGKRAGAGVVAGVLTGGHTSDRLRTAGTTHLIDGIAQLPGLLLGSRTSGAAGAVAGDTGVAGGARAGSAPVRPPCRHPPRHHPPRPPRSPAAGTLRAPKLGAIAQLEEHLLCKQGVGGSSPPSSTRQNDPGQVLGSAIDRQG